MAYHYEKVSKLGDGEVKFITFIWKRLFLLQ